MTTTLFALFASTLSVWAGETLASWRGGELAAWTKRASQCKDVTVTDGVLRGVVTGRDSQLYAPVAKPFLPKGNQVIRLRLKTPLPGVCQIFWIREGDKGRASEARQRKFVISGDAAWQECRIRPGWGGKEKIVQLRLDFPVGFEGGTPFEVSEIVVCSEGEEISVDTRDRIGAAFSLQMPPGFHYCTLTWSGDSGIPGMFGFMPATDGRRHSYWFDLRQARVRSWGPMRGWNCWKGTIDRFSVEQERLDKELPVQELTFVKGRPDLPADPVMTSARPGEAVPRAGRPFPVEVVVRNYGTRPAERLSFELDALPTGVKVTNPAVLTPVEPLPGADGTETINADCRVPLVNERVYRIWLSDLGVGDHRFGVTLKAGGAAVHRLEVKADVKPSLNLAAEPDYPAEPKPVVTAPYEIGAFLFPGWTSHRWHAVWSHAPWRKPLLGWYDEENPETIDWQIKHMVENGISYVFVDWYWNKGHEHLNHWMKAFAKAKFRKYLKWSVMWANHNGKGSHSIADQEKVTKVWIERYFRDPQYQTIDGCPVVTIWSPNGMEDDMRGQGGCKALLDVSRRLAREAGFKDICFVAVRGPDDESPEFLRTFADKGFRRTCVYKYVGDIKGCPVGAAGSRPFKWLADTSLAHWRALKRNSALPFFPSLSTAWDDRPWRGENGWEITGINARDFRRICEDARRYSDETGDRLLLMGPLDEWGEGSIGYPNQEHGFGIFEAVRDTFGQKPAAGWPVNHAPEDVGRACPQRDLPHER